MELKTLTFIIVGLTFALYIGIAIWSRAKSTGDFYVAGKGVHPVANGMATAADWMSAASFISMAGLIAFLGYGGSVFLMGWTGGYVLLAMLLAPYLRKFGKFTVPEFVGDRYYSQTARIVAVICLIVASVTYVIGQMRGIGVAFSRFMEVDFSTGLFTGMGIVFIYAVLGGSHRPRLQGVHDGDKRELPEYVPVYLLVDDRHGGPAPRDHPLLHGAEGQGRPLLRRLGAGLHRHPLHDGPGRRRHGAAQPDQHDPDRPGRRSGGEHQDR
jgi:hypothetical protein